MKKIYFTFLFAFVLLVPGFSQITIGQSDMPQPGDTIRLSTTTDTTGLPPFANTGANYTWDYTKLTPMSQTIDTFLSVTSTPFAYQLFFNDIILYPAYVSTVAQSAPNPPTINPVTITGVIDYYKDGASAYESVGFGANINSLPTSVKDDSIDYVYRFPMNYNNADSCNSMYHLNIPLIGYYGTKQHRVNHVDGWGTLKTPYGTFSALRVTTTLSGVDTLYIDTFHIGFAVPLPQQLQYKWFITGQHVPVLQINENVVLNIPVLSSIVYRDSARKVVNGFAQLNNGSGGMKVYPVPAQNVLYIQSQTVVKDLQVDVYNTMGQLVLQKHFSSLSTASPSSIDLSGIAAGIYFIRAYNNQGLSVFKITKD